MTPGSETAQAFVVRDASDSAPPVVHPGLEEGLDREYVVRALSVSQSQNSFMAVSDDEGDDSVVRRMGDSKSGGDGATSSAADSAHPNTTKWIEDNSSTFKEEDSEELMKAKSPTTEASDVSPRGTQAKDWQQDHEQFRKFISTRLQTLEKHNRGLVRKLDEMQSRGLNEDERKAVIEEYAKKKGEEERREKSIREAAIAEYKKNLRVEEEKEKERRKMLMNEARMIGDRAQKEMNEIYQQTGQQIRQAEQRHQDEIWQIQQQLNSEFVLIERRMHEQLESSAWGIPQSSTEDADNGKGQRVSFEPPDQTRKAQSEEFIRDTPQKSSSLKVPSYAHNRPSELSRAAPETPMSESFPTEIQNTNSAQTQYATDYRPMVVSPLWDNREHTINSPTTPTSTKRPSRTGSRLRRLAKILRLKPVDQSDINVVKVAKRSKESCENTGISDKSRVSSFISRHRRIASLQRQQRTSQEDSPASIPEHAVAETLPDRTQPPPNRLSLPPAEHPTVILHSQLPEPSPSSVYTQPPFFPQARTAHPEETTPHHPPFPFQHPSRPLPPPPPPPPPPHHHQQHRTRMTRVHKSQISPDTLSYYGLPWEWDRVSSRRHLSPSIPARTPHRPRAKTVGAYSQKPSDNDDPFLSTYTTAADAGKYWPVLTNLLFAHPPPRRPIGMSS